MSILWDTKLPDSPVKQNYGEGNLYYFLKPLMYGDFLPTYNSYIYLGGNDKQNFVKFLKLLYQKNIIIFGVKIIINNFDINNKLLHTGYYNYKLSTNLFKVIKIKKNIESEGIEEEKETLPPKEFENFLWFIRRPEIDNKFIVTVKCNATHENAYKIEKFILNRETEHICSKCNFKNYFVSINSNSSDTYFNIKNCRVTLCHNHIKHKYGIELHRKYNDEQIKNKIEFTAKNLRQRTNKKSVICFFSCDFLSNDVGNYIPTPDKDRLINCEIRKVTKNNKLMYGVFLTKNLEIGEELYLQKTYVDQEISDKLEFQDCFKYGKLKKNALPNRITIGEVRKIQKNAPSVELNQVNLYKIPAPTRREKPAKSQAGPNESGGISNTIINLINTYDNNIEKFNESNVNNKIEILAGFVVNNYFKQLSGQSENEQLELFNNTILPKFFESLGNKQAGELIDLITKNSKNTSTRSTTNTVFPAAYNNILYNGNALNIRDYGGSGDCFFRALQGILSKFGSTLTTIDLRNQFRQFIITELTNPINRPTIIELQFYRLSFARLIEYDRLQRQVSDATINCLRQSLRMENAGPKALLNQLFTNLQNNYDQHKVAFANCFTTSMRNEYYYINEAQLPWSGDFIKSLHVRIPNRGDEEIEGLILMNLARDLNGVSYNNSTLYPSYSDDFDANNYEIFRFSQQQATNNILVFRTGEHFQAGFHPLADGTVDGRIDETDPNSYLFDRRIQHWTNANGFPAADSVTIT